METKPRKDHLVEKLFDTQIATCKNRGVPAKTIKILQSQQDSVLWTANKTAFKEGNIFFLPVIPWAFCGLYDLVAMVRIGEKAGYTRLNPASICDKVKTPAEPYYIFDIESGAATRNTSPEEAEKALAQQNRSGVTAVEAIALAIHVDTLSRHNIWAAGSRYDKSFRAPFIWLDGDDRPALSWGYENAANNRWGIPSCIR